jgi:hypothetical protein
MPPTAAHRARRKATKAKRTRESHRDTECPPSPDLLLVYVVARPPRARADPVQDEAGRPPRLVLEPDGGSSHGSDLPTENPSRASVKWSSRRRRQVSRTPQEAAAVKASASGRTSGMPVGIGHLDASLAGIPPSVVVTGARSTRIVVVTHLSFCLSALRLVAVINSRPSSRIRVSYEANEPRGDTDHVRIRQDHATRERFAWRLGIPAPERLSHPAPRSASSTPHRRPAELPTGGGPTRRQRRGRGCPEHRASD